MVTSFYKYTVVDCAVKYTSETVCNPFRKQSGYYQEAAMSVSLPGISLVNKIHTVEIPL